MPTGNSAAPEWLRPKDARFAACVVPVGEETPVSAYLKLRGDGPSFLLESGRPGPADRYSFIGCAPSSVVTGWRDHVSVTERHGGAIRLGPDQLLDALWPLLHSRRSGSLAARPPFLGGAVGYMSADALDPLPRRMSEGQPYAGVPTSFFMFCDRLAAFDHVEGLLWLAAWAPVGAQHDVDEPALRRKVEGVLDQLARPALSGCIASSVRQPAASWRSHTREEYERAVAQAKVRLAEGTVSKLVLSQCVTRTTSAQPLALYQELRRQNPAPYMFYLRLPDDQHFIGSSPARFARCRNGAVGVKPLAGTRPRGRDASEDDALAAELLGSPKERMEHLMMVDLAQAELTGVCQPGSVHIAEAMHVERFAHVMHLASSVTGELRTDLDALDVVRTCLPPGTVSGVPKEEALKALAEIEPFSRGPYGGAVGYVDGGGDAEFCVAIRSMFMHGDKVYLQAGGGIVAGSDPAAEYEESLHKLKPLEEAIACAESHVGATQWPK